MERRIAHAKAQAKKEEGNARYKERNFAAALAAYHEADALDPHDITYLLNAGAALFESGDYEQCVATCKRALERGAEVMAPFATKAKAWARIGNCYLKLNDLPAAVEAFESSLLESSSPDVTDKLRKARADLRKQRETEYIDPAKGEEAKERGNTAFKAGDFRTAVTEYSDAIKRDPYNAIYYSNRALARTRLMDVAAALEDCEAALKLDPKLVKAYIRRGNLQYMMKTYHKALESYQAALALDASSEEAKEGLHKTRAQISATMSGDHDPERAKRAMDDPEIQAIVNDPMVQFALQDLQRNPAAARKVMSDPVMSAKIEKLIAAGILKMG